MKNLKWLLIILSIILSVNLSIAKSQFSSEFANSEISFGITDKCTTYVYNLSTGEMNVRDICFQIRETDHIDFNLHDFSGKRDNEKDLWKFFIDITDNEKLTNFNFHASFFIFEENSEIIQYHCIIKGHEIKALIYNKLRSCWQILLLQNNDYKILTPYSGYRIVNAFNIKPRTSSDFDY